MKNRQFLVNVLVALALIGFVAASLYTFHMAFELLDPQGQLPEDHALSLNPALVHLTNALGGMIGGIVAAAFATKGTPSPGRAPESIHAHNLRSLGNLVYSPEGTAQGPASARVQARFGFIYALTYILVGVVALVIWIVLGNSTLGAVAHSATTFVGMMVPIVATYFRK